jgi:hypothetical protein
VNVGCAAISSETPEEDVTYLLKVPAERDSGAIEANEEGVRGVGSTRDLLLLVLTSRACAIATACIDRR